MAMKIKLLNLSLILTSLFGYLEWGTDNQMFLFQGEMEILTKLFIDPISVLHPFTMLPLIGQIILVFTLFQKQPNKTLTFIGMGCIGLLLFFMFVIGLISLNYKVFISTLPFLISSILVLRHHWKLGNK